jgi:hypothetical protein
LPSRWFPGSQGKPDTSEDEQPGTRARLATEKQAGAGGPANVVQEAAALRAREEAKYLRRSEVCARLKEIAEQSNNADLRRHAEQMEERAWAVYNDRTRHMASSQAAFESDRKTLDRHLRPAAVPDHRSGADLFNVPGREGLATAKEEK